MAEAASELRLNPATLPAALPTHASPQAGVLLAATAGIALLGLAIATAAPVRHVPLYLIGVALGLVLYRSVFGFTSAFRVLLAERRSAGFRAQMVMLGLACLLFFPALGQGSLWGQPVVGFVSPVGVSLVVGAFLFGVGMQLGGGCASGTLYSLGGGSTRMLVTLLFFIVGSVLGVNHLAWWESLPSFGPVSLIASWGWMGALGLSVVVLFAAHAGARRLELARHGDLLPMGAVAAQDQTLSRWSRLWRGPWSLLTGALALAVLNFATLALAGRPWGITSAYGLWGGLGLQAVGVPIAAWSGYAAPEMQSALRQGALADITSVMDFGIMLGALLAAGAAGRFKPVWRISAGHFMASVLGGLLLGYGARLAYGCNIGAFFSGIASGSLHGWLWIVLALAGTWAALPLRSVFGLDAALALGPGKASTLKR
ncbi:YeeE/YedE family protein [Ideonella sp.]|uniref:YeeE/YedE family protein n=1 Tax=Ideonella sp. TaxID=1929293 RepID=UPI003BB604EE